MAIICIDERVWTALVRKIELLAAQAKRLERQYDPGDKER